MVFKISDTPQKNFGKICLSLLSKCLPFKIFSRLFSIFFILQSINEKSHKFINKNYRHCNALQGKPFQTTWLKKIDITGKSTSELKEKNGVSTEEMVPKFY